MATFQELLGVAPVGNILCLEASDMFMLGTNVTLGEIWGSLLGRALTGLGTIFVDLTAPDLVEENCGS